MKSKELRLEVLEEVAKVFISQGLKKVELTFDSEVGFDVKALIENNGKVKVHTSCNGHYGDLTVGHSMEAASDVGDETRVLEIYDKYELDPRKAANAEDALSGTTVADDDLDV
ncbi:hypothetical protein ACES2J_08245 [Bdellovibrio bacteriovorus]|uniref:hypothetical protein n=1 Tax=Bdellovibrio bacteriovorus TaxID=959 RepID=UPI0035A6B1D3